MSIDNEKSLNEIFEEFTFLNLLRKRNLPKWKKKLLQKIWDLKTKDGGEYFSGDTIKTKIREVALENKVELEKIITQIKDSKEGS